MTTMSGFPGSLSEKKRICSGQLMSMSEKDTRAKINWSICPKDFVFIGKFMGSNTGERLNLTNTLKYQKYLYLTLVSKKR